MKEPELKVANAESEEFAQILGMADRMRDALVQGDFDWASGHAFGHAMAAAGMFAGMLFGQMIALGFADDKDRRRMGEATLTNFRQGTDAGKKRVARMMAEQGAGVTRQ